MRTMRWSLGSGLLALAWLAPAAHPANAVIPGASRVDATYTALGVRWEISGDDDGDSSLLLELRRVGESAWRRGAPAMGARPAMIVDGGPLGLHYWAASALFLSPGTSYQLRLTLSDPDGGGEVRTIVAATRLEVPDPPVGTPRYVVPGSGGGSGPAGDPYLGLQSAADSAAPGDVFLVAAGTYADFEIETSGLAGAPIAFVGPGDGSAIVDGQGTDRGVVTVGTGGAAPIAHVVVQGLTIQDGAWGIDALTKPAPN
jgi:hypothetical protein